MAMLRKELTLNTHWKFITRKKDFENETVLNF